MSVRVFLEETHIWSGGLSKEDHPHHCGWASSNPLRTWIKQKGGERADLLSAWAGTPSFSSDIGTPGSPSFRLKSRLTKLVPDHGASQSLELYTYMWNLGKKKGRWGEEEEKKAGTGGGLNEHKERVTRWEHINIFYIYSIFLEILDYYTRWELEKLKSLGFYQTAGWTFSTGAIIQASKTCCDSCFISTEGAWVIWSPPI